MEAHDEGEDKMTGSGAVQVPTAGGDDVLVMSQNTGTVVSWVVAYEWAADEVGDGETIPYFTVTEETNR